MTRTAIPVVVAAATLALLSPPARADEALPCAPDQVAISAGQPEAGVGHRAVPLTLSLIDGAAACTLTGYPKVDSGAGGPLIHAKPTLRGYLGGLPSGTDTPPTVTLTATQQAQAIVEGMAIDGGGNPCPSYTDLLVTLPGTTGAITVPTDIDVCQLQVHPVTDAS
ncbi:DUF4232 domain-containing protein [Mycobacterium szulgai]|uniref:DUF4232 domain-containing protein n=1 Tax=Mycobacterium szulgai TaxID=1787 RepID=UPI001FE94965|nr:DUF4232 domain-containing protein [Mycobacterium szulgai]